MNLVGLIRFFTRGPGIALIIVFLIIAIGWIIKNGMDRNADRAATHQTTRALGAVNANSAVDASQAAREKKIADGTLNPGFQTGAEPLSIAPISNAQAPQQRALPTLVSFYSQVAATPSPTPVPREKPKVQEPWLPPSIFIPCALVNTVESSHINTPVVGEVTRDVYQNGKLIVPAGTLVSSFAHTGAVRDRIEVAGTWLFVFTDGRQLKANGIACDREADPTNQQFGIEDGSAGLQGVLVESDHWANAKAFLALLMTSVNQTVTAGASSVLSRGYNGVTLPDTSGIQSKYLDQLLNGETGDGRFVRVPASTEFYIFPTETIVPADRSIRNSASTKEEEKLPSLSSDPMQQSFQQERQLLREIQPQQNQSNDDSPHFKY